MLYVDHGDVATSAGTGAGIDLCLHLVRADHGAAYAAKVARHMVDAAAPGGRAAPVRHRAIAWPGARSLAPLLEWAAQRLGEPLTVDDLAAHGGVSTRTLARMFTAQLGISPGQWVLAQRIGGARALLEETDLSVDAIAARVGLSSATNLRRRFHDALRTTPAAYRRAFHLRTRTEPPSGQGRERAERLVDHQSPPSASLAAAMRSSSRR